MSRLRIAVIGAGNIAQSHLAVLTNHPECEVAVLCDRDPQILATTGDRFGIAERLSDPEALLGRDDLDAVYVLVSVLHVSAVAGTFIAAGIPTFLEKPPGIYSSDTAHLAELQQRHGTIAMVGLNRRFYVTQLEARRRLLDLGPVATVTVDAHEDLTRVSRAKFPPLVLQRWAYANGIHALDLLRFFGGDVAEVHAFRHPVGRSGIQQGGQPGEADQPDSISAVLRFANGAAGRAAVDWFAPGQHRYEVRTVGAVVTSSPVVGRTVLRVRGQEEAVLEPDDDDRRYKAGFWKQAGAFLSGVRQGKQPSWPAPDLADAHKSMVMIDQIFQFPARAAGD
jgi:predicted dehydrogenase